MNKMNKIGRIGENRFRLPIDRQWEKEGEKEEEEEEEEETKEKEVDDVVEQTTKNSPDYRSFFMCHFFHLGRSIESVRKWQQRICLLYSDFYILELFLYCGDDKLRPAVGILSAGWRRVGRFKAQLQVFLAGCEGEDSVHIFDEFSKGGPFHGIVLPTLAH